MCLVSWFKLHVSVFKNIKYVFGMCVLDGKKKLNKVQNKYKIYFKCYWVAVLPVCVGERVVFVDWWTHSFKKLTGGPINCSI